MGANHVKPTGQPESDVREVRVRQEPTSPAFPFWALVRQGEPLTTLSGRRCPLTAALLHWQVQTMTAAACASAET